MSNRRHNGWYITHSLDDGAFEENGNRLCWGRPIRGEPQTFPTVLHCPFNDPESNGGLKVTAYVPFLEEALEREVSKGCIDAVKTGPQVMARHPVQCTNVGHAK